MQVHFNTLIFQLSEEGPAEELCDGEDSSAYREYELPAREFHGLWDSLIYDGDIKQRLVTYAATALFFSDRCVDSQLISFNRTALLHGEPGTGKTSMYACQLTGVVCRMQNMIKPLARSADLMCMVYVGARHWRSSSASASPTGPRLHAT